MDAILVGEHGAIHKTSHLTVKEINWKCSLNCATCSSIVTVMDGHSDFSLQENMDRILHLKTAGNYFI